MRLIRNLSEFRFAKYSVTDYSNIPAVTVIPSNVGLIEVELIGNKKGFARVPVEEVINAARHLITDTLQNLLVVSRLRPQSTSQLYQITHHYLLANLYRLYILTILNQQRGTNVLTDKQKEVLDFIVKCQSEGYTPSRVEIADEMGITNNAAQLRLEGLIKKGFIEIVPGQARRIKVVKQEGESND